VRKVAPLLLLVGAAIVFGLQDRGPGGSRSALTTSVPSEQERAQAGLTLLDVWSQRLVPNMLLQQARARAVGAGDVAKAARLAGQIRRGLLEIERFASAAADDPILRDDDSVEGRAVRAAAAAWGEWASALLWRPAFRHVLWTRRVAARRARALRLQQAAYAVVDGLFRTALHAEVETQPHNRC
jgi:hypothetical protein